MKLTAYLLLLLSALCVAQSNPFLTGQGEPEPAPVQPGSSFWHAVSSRSSELQREMQDTIAGAMEGKSLHILLGASFLFGLLHALGPGHRKGILIAYFLGEGYAPVKGIAAGFLLAAVHALSAVLLVGGLFFLTSKPLSTSVNSTGNILMTVTWAVILLIGIWMLISGFRHSRSVERNGIGALIASGAVPCPGASAIMILAVSRKAFLLGTLSVVAMSAGMGVLLGATGLISILFRNRMKAFLKKPGFGEKLEMILHAVSGSAMMLFALFMLTGAV